MIFLLVCNLQKPGLLQIVFDVYARAGKIVKQVSYPNFALMTIYYIYIDAYVIFFAN